MTSALTSTGEHVSVMAKKKVTTYSILLCELSHIHTSYTLQQYACYTLPPVCSSSGHYSDGIVFVALEVSEGGFICCQVTELQGGLTTSLRMVGHAGGVEAVGSWA